jgi:hypothetical protein
VLDRVAILAAGAGVALTCFAQTVEDCMQAEILEPAQQAISDSRPTLEWRALPGVSRYRLRLQSRVPEGELLTSIDTLVDGTRFTPPRALADHRAIVKIVVTAPCASPPDLDEGRRLYIDTGLSCRMAPLQPDTRTGEWSWSPTPGAVEYEIYRYAMPEGRLLGRERTQAPKSVATQGSTVLAVRARCENGYSDWQFAP